MQQKIGLDAQKKYRPILARVTQRNLSSWWQELSLRKGAKEQIYSGQGVIFSQGIIGRIYKSGKNYSTVELATNPNFRIVAHFQGDNRPVTFQGSGIVAGGKPMGVVLDVPHDIYIQRDQNLILETSALGGTFPGGLNIGVVRDLEESGDGLFKTGNVFLPNGLAKVSEVTILSSQLD